MRQRAASRSSSSVVKSSPPATTLRPELAEMMGESRGRRDVQAKYDAAGNNEEFANYWAQTDHLNADTANSQPVRRNLVSRSRYESESNPISDGIIQTHANYVVGKGPTLRMQTASNLFNRMIEREWEKWAKRVQLRRKLYCMAQAKPQDGEAFAVARNNPGMVGRIKLDVVLYETEQCHTPMLNFGEVGHIDGVKFDDWGNPEYYDILRQHPGGQWGWSGSNSFVPEQIPAKFVLHWYALRRPGQHRGVPEMRSSLQVGAASRRMCEATVSAVETAARLGAFIIEQGEGGDWEMAAPGSSVDIKPRAMTVMAPGQKGHQLKSEHPNSTFKEFQRDQVSRQARPLSMPHNLAGSDSSDHNFASGRLDFIPYHLQCDTIRLDGDDCVLDKLFAVWYSEAGREFGWYGDPDVAPAHSWDWPPYPIADEKSDTSAKSEKLRTGQTSPSRLYAAMGLDWDDELIVLANDYFGNDQVSEMTEIQRVREYLKLFRNVTYNSKNEQSSIMQVEESAARAAESLSSATSA